jgi:hypothetical protein
MTPIVSKARIGATIANSMMTAPSLQARSRE